MLMDVKICQFEDLKMSENMPMG